MIDHAQNGGSDPDAPTPSPDVPPPDGDEPEAVPDGPLGVVLGGGGARAAYQVGVLRFLARRFPDLRFKVISGVSAGAINAAHLASHHGDFTQAVDELVGLWEHLRIQDVFRTDTWSLVRNLVNWGVQLVSGGMGGKPRVKGLVDTRPLHRYLTEVLHCVDGELTGIGYNLEKGRLRAVGLSTSSYTTGRSVTWLQAVDEVEEWERPRRVARRTTLTVDHVMASSALPLFFPAIQLEDGWYGDGGLRLANPVAPAIHMGAGRVLVLSTRYANADEEARAVVRGYPPPAQVVGQLVNSIFLDNLDQDAYRVEMINRLVSRLPEEERHGLRPVELLTIRPSRDLGRLATGYEPQLPRVFRWLTRGLGTRETESPDALSMILFQHEYIRLLLEIGESDAAAREEEIVRFLRGESSARGRETAHAGAG